MKNLSKCPNCGANLEFMAGAGTLACQHCGTKIAMPVPKTNVKLVRKYTPDLELPTSPVSNSFTCSNCGTSHVVQDGKTSTRCPNCGNTNITANNDNTICPDGIVPFSITKQEARQTFLKWIKRRKFAPNGLLHLAQQGKITQVYVPMYNFSGNVLTTYNAVVKKVMTDKQSDTIFSNTYTVRDVDNTKIENRAFSANSVVEGDKVQKVAGIDPKKIVPFSTEYLLGYYASTTNIGVHESFNALLESCQREAEDKVRAKLKSKYDEIESLQTHSRLSNITFNYTYVPVFVNHFCYRKKCYHCYIGGDSGKVAGNAPKSAAKIAAVTLGVLGLVAISAILLLKLL